MNRHLLPYRFLLGILGVLAAISISLLPAMAADDGRGDEYNWARWRGPFDTGVAPHANPPIEWSEEQNIRWKIALPGKGHSTPIIWGDRVFVTTAIAFGEASSPGYSGVPGAHNEVPVTRRHRFVVICVSRRDGEVLWERTVREDLPHAGGHITASLASHSLITDGEHVFASFGSYGLYCLGLDGELVWEKGFGRMDTLHGHGEGSSPALYQDVLVVNWDHEGDSFLLAFDKRTGKERWKVERDSVTSWTTPLIVEHGDVPQVIISGSEKVRAYDLASGKVIWECGGLSVENVVATPVAGDGVVYVGSSYDKNAVLAIRLDGAQGDITGTDHVVWSRTGGAPYVPSPLLYGDSLYFLRHFQGILTRVDAQTGEDRPGPFRLNGLRHVFASPIGAADRVYITDRDGTTIVISHDDTPEHLGLNRLDDGFSASAAIVGRELFLRGEKYLYCIAEE